jgi:hypothetical protein
MQQDITIDIVREMHQNARFFKGEADQDLVEISFVGSKDTLVKKVTPQHMAAFREEWNAYCDGRPPEPRKGTPLTDVRGLDALRSDQFIRQNVHTAEELAALNDIQCQQLGHGTLVARKEARELLRMRGEQAATTALNRISDATKKIGVAPAEPAPDIAEMKADIAGLKDGMSAILAALESFKPKKPGRPKKEPA